MHFITELHFRLLEQIKSCKDENLKIQLCKQDIGVAKEFADVFYQELDALNKRHVEEGEPPSDMKLPRYPSFQTLVIYYEKRGLIEDAIDICEMALEYGYIADTMKGGTAARLEKLKKKLEKIEEK